MFGVNAEIMVDRGADLKAIGGRYGNQKPTDFIACTLKLLQIQPEPDIVKFLIEQKDEKYLAALAVFYLRLTGTSLEVYQTLEPLLEDRRKLRKRLPDGSYKLTFMDEFVDELLHSDHSCDTILPRLTKRYILEDQGLIEPRVSPLEEELDDWQDEEVEPLVDEEQDNIPSAVPEEEELLGPAIPLEDIDPLHKEKKKKWSSKKVKGLFKKEKPKERNPAAEGEEEDDRPRSGFKDINLTFHEANILRANMGLPLLKPPPGTGMGFSK
ncbi:Pre-mRNA-splicing factor 38A [Kappamyces sp. JEL0829]|nr:Pre-mRNA-splicing factor 38A [Kappamyces sp. JEL0829]KAJ3363219.1 Pre-mRNA-splicing factor 38A [Kappamyces sp. JEL0680]